ncbi:tripartite tricarboxylate transporter substrate binding protein [Castellaniella sp.]|uniref:tripartite tricarboxylate transporter substrate binding protein n=1 Tax=Castellaniella sp. TaxID=1955812 RepID=UPI00355CE6B9
MKTDPLGRMMLAVVLAVAATSAMAAFPERPITLIVPWGAGGGTDATARIIGSIMEKELGKPVNVINRSGGNGVVGHQAMANAKPDGYTLGMATVEITMMHHLGLTDLTPDAYTPLALMNFDPSAITVSADSPFHSIKDLLAFARDNPGKLKASGDGEGGVWHLALAGMLSDQGIAPDAIRFVPSDGASPGLLELVAGGVDIVPASLPEARAMIDNGKARTLAIMDNASSGLYPDIPTLAAETGSDWTMGAWRGIVAPKGLPADVSARLEEVLDRINHSQEYKDFMDQQGYGIVWANGADFGAFMAKADADMGTVMGKVGLAKD